MLEKIISEFQSICSKYLQSEKTLSLKLKKTLLVNLNEEEESDEDMNASQQQKQLAQANLQFEKELLVEREREFQKIEANVIDINQIMQEISTLIHGEMFAIIYECCSYSHLITQNKAKALRPLTTRFHL